MDFKLNEDQRAFADMAQQLFADYCADDALRAHDASDQPFMQALWAECVKAGLHSMIVPESAGGLGLGMTELMAVLEQQGRALALVPLWEQQLAAATLAQFADSTRHQSVLDQALTGSPLALSLTALQESSAATLRLRKSDTGWHLHGEVATVALGHLASHALIAVYLEGASEAGMRLVLVPLNLPGVRRVEGRTQHHLGVADLHFEHVELTDESLLAPAAMGWLEPRAIACLAALQMGVTQQQLQRTVDYVSERRQFGRVIGSFQLVAGQMADGYIALEALRTSVWQLVYRLDAGLGVAPQSWATRALANDTGHSVGHMAQHVHGGIGVDISYPIHRFLYWSRALNTVLGGSEHHLALLGDWLADNDNLGWKYDSAEDKLHATPL
jgi:alkylation response protein AidB-like acyl-CoA dehydrogenase